LNINAGGKLPELLPKPALSQSPGSSSSDPTDPLISKHIAPLQRRTVVSIACGTCQAKKRKCDGLRPTCTYCKQQDLQCSYEAAPGESRVIARKRKQEELQRDLDGLQELYGYLRTRSEQEVNEIVRRIGANHDPFSVLHSIRDGDLLVQASTGYRDSNNQALQKLNQDALQRCTIKVPARPWTVIANDGVVSELISIFFATEHPFIATFVDKECFLREMKSGDIKAATLCSPFLVNAICSYSSVRRFFDYWLSVVSTRGRFFLIKKHGALSH